VGHVAHKGKMRNEHTILVGKRERKKRSESPRRRREDNTKMDPTEIGFERVNWINLRIGTIFELLITR
jgi:hypothetical protein